MKTYVFETTQELLETLKPYTTNTNITVDSEEKEGFFKPYKSDFVMLDEKNHICFDVFENEIIVFYFTGHTHFEDYSSEPEEGQDDYVKRAKEFLTHLFECRIRHIEYYKGKRMSKEKYHFLYDDGREEYIDGTWFGLERFINPFGKKRQEIKTWQFDKQKGCFINRYPKNPDVEAIEVIDVSGDCYIEIFKRDNTYFYGIMKLDFDEYYGEEFWTPFVDTAPTGFYDTKEKAITHALDALKNK